MNSLHPAIATVKHFRAQPGKVLCVIQAAMQVSLPAVVRDTVKSALNVSMTSPPVHDSRFDTATLPSNDDVLNTPAMVGHHCMANTHSLSDKVNKHQEHT